ncbi:DUF262 domain-containing protein [Streptomyces sp. NBC_01281]|uniref:DUF262 domain-containing protein n=1 Tax=Streptomyces sp. NBC_01281 TaxID=2903811 RepID=UPI002E15E932|nr:DUF262 domain-containing protein [Streptomyces sp. NBC_01281]
MASEFSQSQAQRFLEATTQTVSWFWKAMTNGELVMKPPFQRNPVWQEAQKAYLIDTILRGYPAPELYLQTTIGASGEEKHIVVDGQQRIRACMEFAAGKLTLGEKSGPYSGLGLNDLPPEDRARFWGYKFVIRTLPQLEEAEIRGVFERLNKNNVALSRQELRQATYWGEFISSVTGISKKPFWLNSGLFTANDFRRMLDIEYVSELVVAMLFGPQNKKALLDTYYADFEAEFPDRQVAEATVDLVLDELTQLLPWPNKLRWSRKVDFYSLFLVLSSRSEDIPFDKDERQRIQDALVEFSASVKNVQSLADADLGEADVLARAYARGVRNSSDLGSRRLRIAALKERLWPVGAAASLELEAQDPDALDGLPTVEELFAQVPLDEDNDSDEE